MNRLIIISVVALAVTTVVILGVRGQTSTRPPLQGFWDMADQDKYKPQAESEFFADGRSMRLPPANTIAWGRDSRVPNPAMTVADDELYTLSEFPAAIAGRRLTLDKEMLVHGQALFNVHCAVCHGYSGSGNGITAQYGQIVPSYHTDKARTLPVGEIYRIITDGRGQMPGYGGSIAPADRFAVMAYLRALQVAHSAEIQAVPAGPMRDKLLGGEDQ